MSKSNRFFPVIRKSLEEMSHFGSLNLCESNLTCLKSPSEYYEMIKSLIKKSEKNIIFSALYLGNGTLEKDLVETLRDALMDPKRPDLKVTIILDHSRAQRNKDNSISSLDSLLSNFEDRFNLFLYKMPQLRTAQTQILPIQLKEAISVYHCKYCIFDYDLILTGANLSHDYFTNRQDRYFLISNEAKVEIDSVEVENSLVNYLYYFTTKVTEHSHRVFNKDKIIDPMTNPFDLKDELMNFPGSTKFKSTSEKERFSSKDQPYSSIVSNDNISIFPIIQHSSIGIFQEEQTLINLFNNLPLNLHSMNPLNIDIATPYTSFRSNFIQSLQHFSLLQAHEYNTNNIPYYTIIRPCHESHGFFNGSGWKRYIPHVHESTLKQSIVESNNAIINLIKDPNQSNSLTAFIFNGFQYMVSAIFGKSQNTNYLKIKDILDKYKSRDPEGLGLFSLANNLEYCRENWSFHAKGMWFTEKIARGNQSELGQPDDNSSSLEGNPLSDEEVVCSYIGSSNFGERSWNRDFELGFMIVSNDQNVQKILNEDLQNISKWCKPYTLLSNEKDLEIKELSQSENLFVRFASKIIKSFM